MFNESINQNYQLQQSKVLQYLLKEKRNFLKQSFFYNADELFQVIISNE